MAEAIGLKAILDDKAFQAGLKRYQQGIDKMVKLTGGAAKQISVLGMAAATALGSLLAQALPKFTAFMGEMLGKNKQFTAAMDQIKKSLTGIATTIGTALMPLLIKLAQTFVKILNSPQVQKAIKNVADILAKLGSIIIDLIDGKPGRALDKFLKLIQQVFGRHIKNIVEGFINVMWDLFDLLSGKRVVIEDFASRLAELASYFGLNFDAVSDFFNEFLRGIDRVIKAWQSGGLGGLVSQLVAEFQKAWPAISAELAKWGSQFWGWLTTALATAGGAIASFAQAVGKVLADNWPAIQAQLVSWGLQFWNWLTGKGGAIDQAVAKVGEIATAIATWLEVKWNSTIKPALEKWIPLIWEWLTGSNGAIKLVADKMGELATAIHVWANSPETTARLQQIGQDIATSIINGIGNFFKSPGATTNALQELDRNLANTIQAMGEAWALSGWNIGVGIGHGLRRWFFDSGTAQAIGDAIDAAIKAAINYLINNNILFMRIKDLVDAWNRIIGTMHWRMPWDEQPPSGGGSSQVSASASGSRGTYVMAAQPVHSAVNNSRMIAAGAVQITIQGSTGLTVQQLEAAVYNGVARVMNEAPA